MPLIPAKCTSCGGVLSTDDSKEAAVCPYCGNAYVVEKAIQNFSTTYIVNNNIQANTVVIGGVDKEFDISAGILKKYMGAAVDVIIPDTVLSIAEGAFQGLPIHTVKCNSGLEVIGTRAFNKCAELKSVELNANLKSIGGEAFAFCASLKNVNCNPGLEIIGNRAFYGCKQLTKIELNAGLRLVGKEAFAFCTSLEMLYIPDNVELREGCVRGDSGITLSISSDTFEISKKNGSIFCVKGENYEDIEGCVYVDDKRVFLDMPYSDFVRGCRLKHKKRIFEGKTIEDTLNDAMNYWNCPVEQIEYNVVQEPKYSLLIAKAAIIMASLKE